MSKGQGKGSGVFPGDYQVMLTCWFLSSIRKFSQELWFCDSEQDKSYILRLIGLACSFGVAMFISTRSIQLFY